MTKEFWLVFNKEKHWTSNFLEPGFMHVSIITKSRGNFIFLNPIKNEFEIIILSDVNEKEFVERIKKNHKMLYVKTKKQKSFQFMTPQLPTCVSLVKYIMGIKLNCLTPYKLYSKLLSMKYTNTLSENILDVKEIK